MFNQFINFRNEFENPIHSIDTIICQTDFYKLIIVRNIQPNQRVLFFSQIHID